MFTPTINQLKDKMGRGLRKSLILELSYSDPKYATYTLKDDDYEYKGKTYYSLKKIYMSFEDPTEYMFATHCFFNWKTWKVLAETSIDYQSNTNWLDVLAEWREELEVKLRAKGLQGILSDAQPDNPKGYQARKYLADKGWTEKKVGRPTKEEKQKELDQFIEVQDEVSSDLSRLLN
jgi:hypothetical protein